MADNGAAPTVPVEFHEPAITEDLSHHPPAARGALERFRRELDRGGGLPLPRLLGCDAEARDGTRLAGCVKTYVPWPAGRFGLVLLPVPHPVRPFALRAFAFGVRHPAPNRLSVYAVADRRVNADGA
jgi:hypothetical protein